MIDPGVRSPPSSAATATRSAPVSPSTAAATPASEVGAVAQLPDHHGGLQAHRRREQLLRRLRDQAEPGRNGPDLSTYVGGSDLESGNGLAVDAAGNAYVTGTTKSTNFPTTAGAFDRSLNTPGTCPRCGIDNADGFVFKLDAAGSQLAYSAYLGAGTDIDSPRGITVNSAGNAYIVGETNSTDFPTTAGAFRRTPAGRTDMFVTKLNPAGSALASRPVSVAPRSTTARASRSTPPATPTPRGSQLDRLPDHRRSLRPDGEQQLRPHPHQAEPGRLGARLLDLPRRAGLRRRQRPRPRWCRQRLPRRPDLLDGLPHHAGCLRHHPGRRRRLRHQGERPGLGAGVLDRDRRERGDSVNRIMLDPAATPGWLPARRQRTPGQRRRRGRLHERSKRRRHRRAERRRLGAALRHLSRWLAGRQRQRRRARRGRQPLRHRRHLLDGLPGHHRRVRHGLERRARPVLGDAFVTKLSLTGGTTPPAPAPVPVAPTLVAPADGASSEQPVGFDWNDVTSAASYTVEIDDSSAFTAPLVRSATVTSSAYLAGGLPATTLFWRVRAVNIDGTPARSPHPERPASGRPRPRRADDPRRQPGDGRRW